MIPVTPAIALDESEIALSFVRASGPGGQNVNKVSTAVQLRFDVRRTNARHHLAFGFGTHHCLGFNLARVQGALAVAAVLDGLPGLALAEPAEPRGFAFRRPPALRLRWRTAAGRG